MGGQPSASEKEEQRDKTVCGLQESEQSVVEGQLSATEDGPHSIEGGGITEDVDSGWIFQDTTKS